MAKRSRSAARPPAESCKAVRAPPRMLCRQVLGSSVVICSLGLLSNAAQAQTDTLHPTNEYVQPTNKGATPPVPSNLRLHPSAGESLLSGPVPSAASVPNTAQAPLYFADDNSITTLKALDSLREKGSQLVYPGPSDSVLQNIGNIRSTLGNLGIGVNSYSADIFSYNMLSNANPHSPQRYNGQYPTVSIGIQTFQLTYDMRALGIHGGQLIFMPGAVTETFEADGPNSFKIQQLQYYQSLWNKTVELKVGWGTNIQEFTGVYGVGGNPTVSTQGASALIPVEVGMSYQAATAPTVNMTINGDDGLYTKTGIQRSLSPSGGYFTSRRDGIGLNFGTPDSGVFFIQEAGIRRAASVTENRLWVRLGGMFNTSHYAQFSGGPHVNNWGLYAIVDDQFVKFDNDMPFRGLYFGASALYAPPQVDIYSQHFEGRLYSVGPFKKRPTDVTTVVVSFDNVSRTARRYDMIKGIMTAPSVFGVAYSYTFHVRKGLYIGPSLSYNDHPAFLERYKGAFNASVQMTLAL